MRSLSPSRTHSHMLKPKHQYPTNTFLGMHAIRNRMYSCEKHVTLFILSLSTPQRPITATIGEQVKRLLHQEEELLLEEDTITPRGGQIS